MKTLYWILPAVLLASVLPAGLWGAEAATSHEYNITPVPFTQVEVPSGFWKPRLDVCRDVTIPFSFKKCEETPRIQNFEVAAGLKEGKFGGIYFDDSDVYKVMEGAAYVLALQKDEKLDKYLDDLIAKVAKAQEPDGYLYTSRTIYQRAKNEGREEGQYVPPGGYERWSNTGGHELYCLGHMYEAACAHYIATGKRNFLDVAIKSADLICKTFGPGKSQNWSPGHEEIEMGLARLYRVTGDRKYLDQAKYFLDIRGPHEGRTYPPYGLYNQDHLPVLEQKEAVGHSVRALYLYSGMADVAALTGDEDYTKAIQTIWQDIVERKLYVTGGLGAVPGHEAFGDAYYLPNDTAYCETCAQIAGIFLAQRMFLNSGKSEYIDVLERILYNAMLSGVSMNGDTFFYPNLLTVPQGGVKRSPWFGCSCCPSNVCRFLASMPGYIYAVKDSALYVNLYAASKVTTKVDGKDVTVEQTTNYPWDGKIKLTVQTDGKFQLKLRIPGWARNVLSPGKEPLYQVLNAQPVEPLEVAVSNGDEEKIVAVPMADDYLTLNEHWKAGATIEFSLPMPILRVTADERIAADRGRVALQRGPIVYCVEQQDAQDALVCSLLLKDDTPLNYAFKADLLNGVGTISGKATAYSKDAKGEVSTKEIDFMAVPYYAWDHRENGSMSVWLARTPEAVVPSEWLRFSTSGKFGEFMHDGKIPTGPEDVDHPRMHWWPAKGSAQWMQCDFTEPMEVSSVEIYWFDDTGRGECRVPASWKLLYKDGQGEWKPVENPSGFGVERDQFNRTTFKPVTTTGLRVEMQSQPNFAGGVFEWKF